MPKLLLALIFAATGALAQDYPAREIRSVCNFAAGSGADILVRYYSDALAKLTGRLDFTEKSLRLAGGTAEGSSRCP